MILSTENTLDSNCSAGVLKDCSLSSNTRWLLDFPLYDRTVWPTE